MNEMRKPLIAVPIGDPAGVGPEITVKAAASGKVSAAADCVIVGDKTVMENAIRITGVDLSIRVIRGPEEGDYREGVLNLIDLDNIDQGAFAFGRVSKMCGRAAYEYIVSSLPMPGRRTLWRLLRSIRNHCEPAGFLISGIRRYSAR